MGRAWIDKLGKRQLSNVSKSPEHPVVDNPTLAIRKANEPVNRTANTMSWLVIRSEELRLSE